MSLTMNRADRRMLFTIVKKHLLKQMEQSKGRTSDRFSSICFYHADNGLKCAVGILITKPNYNKKLEGGGIHPICSSTPVKRLIKAVNDSQGVNLDAKGLYMLDEMQDVHDDNHPDMWAELIDELEADFIKRRILE